MVDKGKDPSQYLKKVFFDEENKILKFFGLVREKLTTSSK